MMNTGTTTEQAPVQAGKIIKSNRPEIGDVIVQTLNMNFYCRTRYKVIEEMTALPVSFTKDCFAKDDAEKPCVNPTPVKITKWETDYYINGRPFKIVRNVNAIINNNTEKKS